MSGRFGVCSSLELSLPTCTQNLIKIEIHLLVSYLRSVRTLEWLVKEIVCKAYMFETLKLQSCLVYHNFLAFSSARLSFNSKAYFDEIPQLIFNIFI